MRNHTFAIKLNRNLRGTFHIGVCLSKYLDYGVFLGLGIWNLFVGYRPNDKGWQNFFKAQDVTKNRY